MQKKKLIDIDVFCSNNNIDISFICSLQKTGLIEITSIKETKFIDTDQLIYLEKIVRLFYDLDINLEGIETITHLLLRINSMHDEIIELRNKLRVYEI